LGEIGTDIALAADFLRQNKCVAIPTETVYGLAANALQDAAVAKIFAIKKRPAFDPLIVHIADISQIHEFVTSVPLQAMELAKRFWPGPLTLLLPKKEIVPDITTSGLSSVGVRIPAHPMTLQLLQQLPFPLAAPSANPFGYISPTSAQHVAAQLGDEIDYLLDGGDCAVGLESTIIDFTGFEPIVRRWGGITAEMLQPIMGDIAADDLSTSHPQAPGMLLSHYAPRKPLYIGNIRELLNSIEGEASVLSYKDAFPGHRNIRLSDTGDLREAARNLFSAMRELDADDTRAIVAEWVPDTGLGRAINDRLRRAAAK